MLYALYYKKDDDEYWSRILKWNKNPDIALLSFLGVKQCFWQFEQQISDRSRNSSGGGNSNSISQIRDRHFVHAIETLQHIKTKFTPLEKLSVILDTFREINRVGQEMSGASFCWSMDELFPVFQYIVIRARILQLGAEIHLIQDLVESYLLTGEYGFMLITLQAAYYQILKESLSI
jgi:amyotrophic lateral sclerosis 2 protein